MTTPTPSLTRHLVCAHPNHELTWVVHGSVLLESGGSSWRLTPEQALWIPAGTTHTVRPQPGSLVFPVQISAHAHPSPWSEATALQRTPMLDALTAVLLQPGLAEPNAVADATERIVALLPTLRHTGELLPMPTDPRARAVAEDLLADPARPLTLEQWASRVHTSSKTLQRCFVSETNMAFPQWRTAARLAAALPLLERGDPVAAVSGRVGYSSVSGFIAAFHRRYGYTPARHRGLRAS